MLNTPGVQVVAKVPTAGPVPPPIIVVMPEYRNRGYGKALLKKLAQITVERGCGRLEWACLDWNRPSIDFYLSLGAVQMNEWTTYRLTGETLNRMAESEA